MCFFSPSIQANVFFLSLFRFIIIAYIYLSYFLSFFAIL